MYFSIAILLLFVSHSFSVFDYTHRCLLYNKTCVSHCPRMMHPYHTRCDGQTLSQLTCTNPEITVLGFTCGWSRCDCNGDLLLDDVESGLCMPFKECPVLLARKYRRRKGPNEPVRQSKRVKIPKAEIEDEMTSLD